MDGIGYFIDVLTFAVLIMQPVLIGLIVWCLIEVKAMQKSTHSIQYVEPKFEKMTEEVKDILTKDLFENVN